MKVHIPDRPVLTSRVTEANVFKNESFPDQRRDGTPGQHIHNRRLHLKEIKQIFKIEALLVNPAGFQQQALNEIATARKGSSEEGQRAKADGTVDGPQQNGDVGAVITSGSND